MNKEKIDRINALARAAKERVLTSDEKAEQAALRTEYLAEIRASFGATLSAAVVKRPDGSEEKLNKKSADDRRVLFTATVEETEAAGRTLAREIDEDGALPRFVALYGDLGVGKTAFVRGFTAHFAPRATVHSPTFTLVNEYRGQTLPVFHFDLYRVESEDDLYSIGFDDYLSKKGVILTEWGEKIPAALPAERYDVTIEKIDAEHPDRRKITVILKKETLC